MRARYTVVAVGLSVGLCAGCVAPAATSETYAKAALRSVQAAESSVSTADLALQQVLDGRLPMPYATVVVQDAERSSSWVQDVFGSRQPPSPADDQLRDAVTMVLADAADAVADARIALGRSDKAAMRDAVQQLEQVSDDLSGVEDQIT